MIQQKPYSLDYIVEIYCRWVTVIHFANVIKFPLTQKSHNSRGSAIP